MERIDMQKQRHVEIPVSLWADVVKYFALPDEELSEHAAREARIRAGIEEKMAAMVRHAEWQKKHEKYRRAGA